MKKFFYSILAVAAIVASCTKVAPINEEIKPVNPSGETTALFTGTIIQPGGIDDATKVSIIAQTSNPDKVFIKWTSGDQISIIKKGSDEWNSTSESTKPKVFSAASSEATTEFTGYPPTDWIAPGAFYAARYYGKNDVWKNYVLACDAVTPGDPVEDITINCNSNAEAAFLENMPLSCGESEYDASNFRYNFKFSNAYAILQINVPSKLVFKDLYVCVNEQNVKFESSQLTGDSKYTLCLKGADAVKSTDKYKNEDHVTYFVPVSAGSYDKLTIVAAKDDAEVARMETYVGNVKNGSDSPYVLPQLYSNNIYPFDFCNTKTINEAGTYSLESNNGIDYKVNIAADIDSDVTINAEAVGKEPANIYINNRGHKIDGKLTINAKNSHVEGENGIATEVEAKTSATTFVVKSTLHITGLTVKKGSVVVSKNDQGESTVESITVPSTVTEDINITIEKLDANATPVHVTNESTSANVNVTGIKGENAEDKGTEFYVDGAGAENVHSTPTADVIKVHPDPDFSQAIPQSIKETLGSNLFYESGTVISGIPVPSVENGRLVLKSDYSGVYDFSNGLSLNQIGNINGLDVCYIFAAKDSDGSDGSYDNWYADFVVSLDKDVNKDEIGLWGFYASWGISMAFPTPQYIPAGTEVELLGLMSSSGHSTFTYSAIKNDVKVFPCGAFKLSDNINGATMTVDLRIYNPNSGHEGEYIVIDSYKYKFTNKTNAVITPIGETGVAKIGDTSYETLAEAITAAEAGDVVSIVKADTYKVPNLPKNVTIVGKEGVVFDCTGSGSIASIPNGATFKKVTMNFGQSSYHGFQHAGHIKMEGCTLNGLFFSYGEMTFNGCTFNQEKAEYHMWDYGTNLTYKDCTFNGHGKYINVYNEGTADPAWTLNVSGCKFVNLDDKANKAPLNIKETCGANLLAYDVTVGDGNTTEGAFPAASQSATLVVGDAIWQVDDRSTTGETKIKVTVGGLQVYPFCSKDSEGNYHIVNADGLLQFHDLYAAGKVAYTAKVYVENDIDFTGKTWDACDWHADAALKGFALFDGQKHTIKNFTVSGQGMFSRWACTANIGATPYFKDIVFDGAKNVTSTLNVSLFCGQVYQNANIENVTIKNSQFEGTYKVAPFVGTVYDEKSANTVTLTMKDCKVENTTVRGTAYDFDICGMAAFVYEGDNDKIAFEGNNVVKDVTLYIPSVNYNQCAKIYHNGETAHDEATNVTVTNVNTVIAN